MHFFFGQEVDKKSQLFIELKCFKLFFIIREKGKHLRKTQEVVDLVGSFSVSASAHIEYDFYGGFYSSNLARNYFNSSRRVTT